MSNLKKYSLLIIISMLILFVTPMAFAADTDNNATVDVIGAEKSSSDVIQASDDKDLLSYDDEGIVFDKYDYVIDEGENLSLSGKVLEGSFGDVYDEDLDFWYTYVDSDGVTQRHDLPYRNSVMSFNISGLKYNITPYKIVITPYHNEKYEQYTGYGYDDIDPKTITINVRNSIPEYQTLETRGTIYVDGANGNDDNNGSSQDSPLKTIQAALDKNKALWGNYEIIINEGTYYLNNYFIDSNVRIIGKGRVVIDAQKQSNHFNVRAFAEFYNLTFINGKNSQGAGSIETEYVMGNDVLNIINCTFEDNSGINGAIKSNYYTTILKTTFVNNNATGSSASMQGIIGSYHNNLTINYCNFINNSVAGSAIIDGESNINANFNYWGTNSFSKSTMIVNTGNTVCDYWIVCSLYFNANEIYATRSYTTNLEFKVKDDNNNSQSLFDVYMPDLEVNVTVSNGAIISSPVVITKNKCSFAYTAPLDDDSDKISLFIYDTEILSYSFEIKQRKYSSTVPYSEITYFFGHGSELLVRFTANFDMSNFTEMYVWINGEDISNRVLIPGAGTTPSFLFNIRTIEDKLVEGINTVTFHHDFKESDKINATYQTLTIDAGYMYETTITPDNITFVTGDSPTISVHVSANHRDDLVEMGDIYYWINGEDTENRVQVSPSYYSYYTDFQLDLSEIESYLVDGYNNITIHHMVNKIHELYPSYSYNFKVLTVNYVVPYYGAIYVDQNGRDSNRGDEAHPVKTLDKAIELITRPTSTDNKIIIKEGTYSYSGQISKSLEITGIGNVVIVPEGENRHLTLSGFGETFTLNNLTFANGNHTSEAGSIVLRNYAHLYLNNCTFINNTGGYYGIVNTQTSSRLIANGCYFINNTINDYRGFSAFFTPAMGATLNVTNSYILNNNNTAGEFSFIGDVDPTTNVYIENNYWGSNDGPASDQIKLDLLKPDKWIKLEAELNDTVIYSEYTYNLTIRLVLSNGTLSYVMNDLHIALSSNGTFDLSTPTISNNQAVVKYTPNMLGNNSIIFKFGDSILYTLPVTVLEPIVPNYGIVYVDTNGNDTNRGFESSPVASIAKAIEIASDVNSVHKIIIREGTYTEHDLIITSDLDISADGDVVIDAQQLGRIFTINYNTTNISGITFKNGKAEKGNAIYIASDAVANVINSNFTDNGNADEYSIYNLGILALNGNAISNVIYNNGTISSSVKAIFLENKTVSSKYKDNVMLNATLTVDDGNKVYDPNFKFSINGETIDEVPNYENGLYTLEYYIGLIGTKIVSTAYDSGNLEKFIGILDIPKANVTEFYFGSGQNDKIPYGENVTIFLALYGIDSEGLNETVTVVVNNIEYTLTLEDGEGSFNVSGLEPGNYAAFAIFNGNDNYNTAYATGLFSVLNPDAKLSVVTEDITYGEDAIINISLTEADGTPLTGPISIVVNDFVLWTDIAGEISINVPNLAVNETGWRVLVNYQGDNLHTEVRNDTEIVKVAKRAITPEVLADGEFKFGEDANVFIFMNDPTATGNVTVFVDGVENQTVVLDKDDAAEVYIPGLAVGNHTIGVKYNGNDIYNASEIVKTNITVGKAGSEVFVSANNITYGDNVFVNYNVFNKTDIKVTVYKTGEGAIEPTMNIGADQIVIEGLLPGDYQVTIENMGNEIYDYSFNGTTFSVNKADSIISITTPIEDAVFGNNVTVNFEVEHETEIEVLITNVNGTEIESYVRKGNSIVITDLVPGDYTIMILNNENDLYNSDVDNASFTVKKADSIITITPIEDAVYGDDITVDYTVENGTTVYIDVFKGMDLVYNDTIVVSGSVYTGSFVLNDLPAGDYQVGIYTNLESEGYEFIYAVDEFTIEKADPTFEIRIADDIKVGDEDVEIKVTLPVDATGLVTVVVDGNQISIGGIPVNGSLNVTVPSNLLTVGNHSYTVNVHGDNNYEDVSGYSRFEVSKVTPTVTIALDESEIGVAAGACVNISVASDATGKLLIDNDGAVSVVELTNGNYTLEIYDLVAGEYYINVTYFGDGKYNEANASKEFIISKADVEITYETVTPEIKYGEEAIIKVDIDPDFANGNVTVLVDNVEYGTFVLDDDYANATITLSGLTIGAHNITVTYNGNENYNEKTVISENAITVAKATPTIKLDGTSIINFGEYANYTVTVDAKVDAIALNIWIDGVEYKVTGPAEWDSNVANFMITSNWLPVAKDYNITVQYIGNENYTASENVSQTLTVLNTTAFDFDISFPENSTDAVFSIKTSEYDEGYLLVDIDGKHYYAPVENGAANVTVSGLAPGNYTAKVTFTGSGATKTKQVTIPSNLPEDALTIPEAAETDAPATYSIKLPSDATGYLEVDVDGTKYIAPLVKGSASITIPALSEGNHNVTVSYSGDGKYSSASKSINLTVRKPVYKITQNKNVAAIYSATASYKVLITKDGKAVGAGVSVTIKYNGKTYTVKTNSKGYATLKLNTKVKVKKYTITATYKGVTVKNTVQVKHLIKATNKKAKKSKKFKLKVKTYKVNGKYLKGKKLKLKFKGKTYKAKISKKGVAKFTIKKKVMKKLKKGKKYKYTVSYGKDKVTKKIKIKR